MFAVNLARKLAISVVSLVVVFLAAELAARYAEPGPMSFFDQRPYVKVSATVHEHQPGFEGRWDGTWYEINSKGMRGPEFEPDFSPDEYRVLAIGDSCTFGKGVLEVETWPRQLERMLQAEMPERDVMVANLGVNGYSSRHYRRILKKKGLDEKPHLIVVGFNINDFPNITARVDKEVFQGKKSLRARVPGPLREGLGNTAIFRWLRSTYYHMRREADWARMERVAAAAIENKNGPAESAAYDVVTVRDLLRDAQESGAQVAVFLFPYESMVYLDDYNRGPGERLARVAEPFDLPVIDMAERFREVAHETDPPRSLFLRGDRYHPNAEGYRIVAETVLETVLRHGWLELARQGQ